MPRLLILLAAGFIAWYGWNWLEAQPPEQRKKHLRNFIIWGLVAASLALVATGRLHWVGAALASLLAVARNLLPILIRVLPFISKEQGATPPPQTANTDMTLDEAYAILGLQADATETDVIDAHRKLMGKIHPDKGGNDYLAAQLNNAKDLLLASINKT